MKIFLLLLLITNFGFAQLLDSSKIMDSLLATIPSAKNLEQYDDFKSISIDGGKGYQCKDDNCKDTLMKITLPAGILMSDRKAYLFTYYEKMIEDANRRFIIAKEVNDAHKRQFNVLSNYYDKRIQELEKQNKRSWFERNNIYIGFVIGIATAIAIESITVKALD